MINKISKEAAKDLWTYYKELDAQMKELTERYYKLTDEVGKLNLTVYFPDVKPTLTDEDLVEKYIAVLKATTPGTPWDFHLISNILRQLISEART